MCIRDSFLHTVHLAEEGHPWWSLATGIWLLLSVLVSVAGVLVGRLRTGDGMHPAKSLLLTALVHADTVEAFVEAGPELKVQLVILWTGVHTHDFEVGTTTAERLAWIFGLSHNVANKLFFCL